MARDPRPNSSTIVQPSAISLVEAASRLGISRSTAYAAAEDFLAGRPNGLPCVRIRSRIVVPLQALEGFLRPALRTPEESVVRQVK